MTRFLFIALTFLSSLLWIPLTAQAVEMHGLYEADVDVPDQTPAAREAAFATALGQVLVKASGLSSTPDSPALADVLKNASQYVRQFSYRVDERTPDAPPVAPDQTDTPPGQTAPAPEPVKQLVLTVRFDPPAVDSMLREHQLPVWGTARPRMLIWLAVDQGGQRLMVSATDQGLARQVIEDEAQRRALPVVLPALDATDQQKIQPADVWGGFRETLRDASERYHPQAILAGRLQAGSDGKWTAHWLLMQGDLAAEWDNADADVENVLKGGVSTAADAISSRMTENLNEASRRVVVEVAGVNNMDRFQKVNSYLRDLNGITGLRVEQVWPDRIRFSMEAPGGADAVVQRIRLGSTLKPVEPPPSAAESDADSNATPAEVPAPTTATAPPVQVSPLVTNAAAATPGAATPAGATPVLAPVSPAGTATPAAGDAVPPAAPIHLAPRVIYCQLVG